MKTLLTIKQQKEFINNNWNLSSIEHKWSSRGYGNSKILDINNNVISKASGCGYDRFGTVIGDFIEKTFPNELNRLAKRFCKTKYAGNTKSSKQFYGLFLRDGVAYLDGACGYDCMFKILNCIGFELKLVSEKSLSNNGYSVYVLNPVSNHNKKYIVNGVK